ncbi:peroxisomal N(1)-acetyl-spermine/spermidine oxidase isoform X3 [Patagioenas fasciata]|uniref:peroxisomal N(1)-acetyl-spermine/spermidine oxidase isoform X3 n=1 Tax=Patagioenas fasciata TaxID=372321 RepID=UPI0032E8AA58
MEGGGGRRVLVVGAGLAGLGAVQRLRGPGSLRLLEAAPRAGGRVCTRPFASGLAEMGAHWIHGPSPGNPVFRLAMGYSLLGLEAAREENQQAEAGGHPPLPSVTYGSSGRVLSPRVVREARDLFDTLLASTRAFQGAKELPAPSVGQYLREEIARRAPVLGGGEEEARQLQLAVLAACFKLECCISGTHSMDLVALEPFGEYVSLPGLDCTFPGGYGSLPDRMLSSLPEGTVLLNKAVRTIQWRGSFREEGDQVRDFPVRVECEDGDAFLADHVIVTVPLGFLKERHQDFFQPPLPQQKAEAIRRLGFGTNNKIFLEFEQPFWEPQQQLLEVVWEDESPLEEPNTDLEANWFKKLIGFVVLQPPEQHGHVLCGFIAGKESEYMETLSDTEVLNTMTHVLRMLTGTATSSALATPTSLGKCTPGFLDPPQNLHLQGTHTCLLPGVCSGPGGTALPTPGAPTATWPSAAPGMTSMCWLSPCPRTPRTPGLCSSSSPARPPTAPSTPPPTGPCWRAGGRLSGSTGSWKHLALLLSSEAAK